MSSTDTDTGVEPQSTDSSVVSRVPSPRDPAYTSTRSRLYSGGSLPNYRTFLAQLHRVELGTLSPGAVCPVCRDPYTESLATCMDNETENADHERILTLSALPFHEKSRHDTFDRPVRLPCAAGHIVGSACMASWATEGGARTCPLDREELFRFDPDERPSRSTRRTDLTRWFRGERQIGTYMPVRTLFRHFLEAPADKKVTVNAHSMVQRLAPLILRVVHHHHGVNTDRWRWGSIPECLYWNEEAPQFRKFVRWFIQNEALVDGRYPPHVNDLLHPVLPHIFALLHRLAQLHQAQTYMVHELASALHMRMQRFFRDFEYLIPEEGRKRLRRMVGLTIDVWVAQELLMTQLREETNQPNEWDDGIWFSIARQGEVGYFAVPSYYLGWGYLARPPSLTLAADIHVSEDEAGTPSSDGELLFERPLMEGERDEEEGRWA